MNPALSSTVSIRVATDNDLDLLAALGLTYHLTTAYGQLLMPEARWLRDVLAELMAGGRAAFFVAEDDTEIIGMVGTALYMHPVLGHLCAYQLLGLTLNGDAITIALTHRAESWARSMGARLFQAGAHTAEECAFYEAREFTRCETIYERRLQ
jgi:hypothetical protein